MVRYVLIIYWQYFLQMFVDERGKYSAYLVYIAMYSRVYNLLIVRESIMSFSVVDILQL